MLQTRGTIAGNVRMRITTALEFRQRAPALLRSKVPILVTRRGRLAGVFLPLPESTPPIAWQRVLYAALSSDLARQLKRRRISEDEVLGDFSRARRLIAGGPSRST
jgi:hypothetical protein